MSSRAEHHADSPKHKVRQSRARIRRVLERKCVGRDNAMHGSDIAELVPIAETTVRDVIAELRDDPDGPPIDSCGDGYYVISSTAELEHYIESMKETIATKQERLQANVRAFNQQRYGGQHE